MSILTETDELTTLRIENSALRQRIAELEHHLNPKLSDWKLDPGDPMTTQVDWVNEYVLYPLAKGGKS